MKHEITVSAFKDTSGTIENNVTHVFFKTYSIVRVLLKISTRQDS